MKTLLVVLAAALVLPASGGASPARTDSADMELQLALKVRNTRYGPILFDAKDRVLYGFTRDKRGGRAPATACARVAHVYFSKGKVKAMRACQAGADRHGAQARRPAPGHLQRLAALLLRARRATRGEVPERERVRRPLFGREAERTVGALNR